MTCRRRTVLQVLLFGAVCLCGARNSVAQFGVRAGDPEIATPAYDKAFSGALTTLLEHASDGFVSERQTKKNFPVATTTLWESGIRFPRSFSNCSVWVMANRAPYMSCTLLFSASAQEARIVFDEAARTLVRILPPDWTVDAGNLENLSRPSVGDISLDLGFRAPDRPEQTLRLSFFSGSVTLYISDQAVRCPTCSRRPVSELKALPKEGIPSAPATIPVTASGAADVDSPEYKKAFSDSLGAILVGTDNGFASLRKTVVPSNNPKVRSWNSGIRFPGDVQDCLVRETDTEKSDIICWNLVPFNSDAQKARGLFADICLKLFQALPAGWTLDERNLEQIFKSNDDLVVASFRAPAANGQSLILIFEKSPNATISLQVKSERGCDPCTGRAVSELKGKSVADIQERINVENAQLLRVTMLELLGRCKEAVDQLEAINSHTGSKACLKMMSSQNEAGDLYYQGRYDEALVAIISEIQDNRNYNVSGYLSGAAYGNRALVESAVGQLEPAMVDFALASSFDRDLARRLALQRAIVLYLYGKQTEGKQACAQALDYDRSTPLGASSVEFDSGLCSNMESAGQRIAFSDSGSRMMAEAAANRREPSVIRLDNPSDLDATVKLIGPSVQGFSLGKGQKSSIKVAAGEYIVLVRYASGSGDYIYMKGGPVRVTETSTEHSEINMALPKSPRNGVGIQKEFDAAAVAVPNGSPASGVMAEPGKSAFKLGRAITGPGGYISSVSFSSSGKLLAVGGSERTGPRSSVGTIKVFETGSGRELWRRTGGYVSFIPDGRLLAANRNKLDIVDPETGSVINTFGIPMKGSIGFSRNGRWITDASPRTIHVWDLSSEKVVYTLTSKKDDISTVALSPDGHLLASGGPSGITLWEVATGKILRTLGSGEYLAFSPDGKTLASVSDKVITLWDLLTGASIRTFSGSGRPVFSPDSRLIASLSADTRKIQVWDLATGSELANLGSNRSVGMTSVAFSPDGQWLAAGEASDIVWIWRRNND